jgi:hypothetical protein
MSIDYVLAVVPVSDLDAAHARHERLVSRPVDNLPTEDRLVDWRVTETGWDTGQLDRRPFLVSGQLVLMSRWSSWDYRLR